MDSIRTVQYEVFKVYLRALKKAVAELLANTGLSAERIVIESELESLERRCREFVRTRFNILDSNSPP